MQRTRIGHGELWNRFGSGVIALAAVLLASGCGYHFSSGGQFPKDVHSVYVAPFVNKSLDVGLAKEISTALKGVFRRGGTVVVVEKSEDADAILSGVVRRMETRVLAVNDNSEAIEFETIMVMDMNLRRRSPDEVLWRGQGSRWEERYSGSRGAVVATSTEFQMEPLNQSDIFPFTDVQLTETYGRQARNRLITRSAHDIHQRIVDLF